MAGPEAKGTKKRCGSSGRFKGRRLDIDVGAEPTPFDGTIAPEGVNPSHPDWSYFTNIILLTVESIL